METKLKLLIISHSRYNDKNNMYGWVHRGLRVLPSLGVNVKYVFREEWWSDSTRIIKLFKPNIILTLGPFAAYYIFMTKKILKLKIPIVHDWHDDYVKTMGKRWSKVLMKKLTTYILSNADFVTTPSLTRYKYLQKINKPSFHWMHGANIKNNEPVDDIIYKTDKLKLMYCGELSPEKGVDKIEYVVKHRDDCKLFLLGKINNNYFFNQKIKNIKYVGNLPLSALPMNLAVADVLVLPQNNDSSIKMSYYFSAKKPIIGLYGELNSYKEYIYLYNNFYDAINEMVEKKKHGKLKPKKIYPIKTEKHYMKQYVEFLKKCVESSE